MSIAKETLPMTRANRIKVLQAALNAVNLAIPILQQAVNRGDAQPSELIRLRNRRDDLAALIADMPAEGALTELNPADVTELGTLETTLDDSIKQNALINATVEGAKDVIDAANRVH